MPLGSEARDARRKALRELLRRHHVTSQTELVEILAGAGIEVTQASVSRDLHAVGARKVDGAYRLPETAPEPPDAPRHREALARLVASHTAAGPHMLVIRTHPGGAGSVGFALDGLGWPEVVGTISGDDTVLVALASRRDQRRMERRLRGLRKELPHV